MASACVRVRKNSFLALIRNSSLIYSKRTLTNNIVHQKIFSRNGSRNLPLGHKLVTMNLPLTSVTFCVRCGSTLTSEERRLQIKARKEAKRAERILHQKRKLETKKERQEAVYDGGTLPGEKKDVSGPLPTAYSPGYVEAAWYEWWEKEEFFIPPTGHDNRETFVVCLPPPNVTGTLHLGHALGNSIQDAICRWHRMQGHRVLWNPGSDHAGIATQAAVEKHLLRTEQLTRQDIGREAFIEKVWQWKNEKGNRIYEQMRRLGSSLDWSREAFTLSPKLSHAVNEAFIRLFDEGLIFRSERLVHWSCALNSAISDIEVDNVKIEGETWLSVPGYDNKIPFGRLVSFAYPIDGTDEEIIVATTRIETMLGDTGIAVNPTDQRYVHLHHKYARHPLTDRLLPIIPDSYVDKDFGTGAVKLTPAHDHNDHDLGIKHNLPSVTILNEDGVLINVPEAFVGMRRFDARRHVLEVLKERGLYRGTSQHAMSVPVCSRSGDVIEPLLKPQWYLDTVDMSEKAIQVVKKGDLEIIPPHYEKQWFDWLENPRPWCISRQLWWGHQVPAYRVISHDHNGSEELWVSAHSVEEAKLKASEKLNLPKDQISLMQDEDVLDTWFSSALFPFSIFGWPLATDDLEAFYPTSLLETASDIMFFWVSRMVMLGQQLTGQLPFKQVLFHSILRDAYGRKMSKSLGNVIDPIDVIDGASLQTLQERLAHGNLDPTEVKKAEKGQERDFPLGIPSCGADALRFTLCSYNYKAHVCNIDVNQFKSNRNFCNKIWQAFRYTAGCHGDSYAPPKKLQLNGEESDTDLWILSRLANLTRSCDQGFKSYDLNHVTQALHAFWWLEFCDVYIEYSKSRLTTSSPAQRDLIHDILYTCIDVGLRSLSPFMPFLTEELYQRLPYCEEQPPAPSVCIAPYPRPDELSQFENENVESDIAVVREFVSEALSLRRTVNLTKSKADVYIQADSTVTHSLTNHIDALTTLSRSKSVTLLPNSVAPAAGCLSTQLTDVEAHLHMQIQDIVDIPSETERLSKQESKLKENLNKLESKMFTIAGDDSPLHEDKIKSLKADLSNVQKTIQELEVILQKT